MASVAYAAIDIGESQSKLLLTTIANGSIVVCANYVVETNGINNGEIVSRIEFKKTVSQLLAMAREDNYDIKEILVVLPSNHLSVYHKSATLNVPHPDGLITSRDIEMLERACARHNLSENDMVVDIFPMNYSFLQNTPINSGKEAPIGYRAQSITLNAYVFVIPKAIVNGYIETIEEEGITILNAVVAPIAQSYLLLSEDDKKTGSLILDIGGHHTSLSYFNDDLLQQNFKFKMGSSAINEKLSEFIGVDFQSAEEIKTKYGSASVSACSNYGVYLNRLSNAYIKETDICIICENTIDVLVNEIKRSVSEDILNSGATIYLTGGGANLANIASKLSRGLGAKVKIRQLNVLGARDPKFNASFGLIINYVTDNGLL